MCLVLACMIFKYFACLQVLTSDNGGYVKSFQGDCDINTPHGYACFNGEAGASKTLHVL